MLSTADLKAFFSAMPGLFSVVCRYSQDLCSNFFDLNHDSETLDSRFELLPY